MVMDAQLSVSSSLSLSPSVHQTVRREDFPRHSGRNWLVPFAYSLYCSPGGKEACASDALSETEMGDQWGAATLSELAEAVTLCVSPQLRGCSQHQASLQKNPSQIHSRLTYSSEAEQWQLDTVMDLKGREAPSLFLFWSNRSVSDLSNERHGNLSNAIRMYYLILK